MTPTTTSTDYKKWLLPLLDTQLLMEDIAPNLRALHHHFSEITGITGMSKGKGNEHLTQKINTASISANGAARCMLAREDVRTLFFFRSLVEAISEVHHKKTGLPVNILYAGCGPYATFLTMVAPLFTPQDIQFTLLEINEVSFQAAKKLINKTGLSKYVSEFSHANAVEYKVRAQKHFDILISETLNFGLHGEPIVPILLNLLPQLPKDVIVIPENVWLDIAFVKTRDLPNGSASDLRKLDIEIPFWKTTVFELKKGLQNQLASAEEKDHCEKISINLPELKDYDFLAVFTKVVVYKNYIIKTAESDFTEPIVERLTDEEKNSRRMEVAYYLKPIPELKYFFVP